MARPGADAGPVRVSHQRVRPPVFWRELLLGALTFLAYGVVAGMDWPARRQAALDHSHDVFRLEQFLHLNIEQTLNSWLLHHDVVRAIANYEYAYTYILSAVLLLGYIYLRRPELFRWTRTSFIVLNLVAIACFAFYPLAPPRLMPTLGFSDTVAKGHTFGSWGSGVVDHANELAAMPSLHLAWALWVSVVLALMYGTLRWQLVSFAHVLITLIVILSTANHYLLDAVGGAVVVAISIPIASYLTDRTGNNPWRLPRVLAADLFFLRVESAVAPQHIGGLILLDLPAVGGTGGLAGRSAAPSREEIAAIVSSRLAALPRFRQRLSSTSQWRRPRWLDEPDLDWDWHIVERDLTTPSGAPGGLAALNTLVAQVQSSQLPRDRPLWRMVVVHGVTAQQSAVILIVHHVVADGFGTIAQALELLEPRLPIQALAPGGGAGPRRSPGPLKTLLATTVGLAQLAADGRPKRRLPAADTAQRCFGTVRLPLAEVRRVAHQHRARVSDVLLTVVAGGLARSLDPAVLAEHSMLRTSVPLMVREPDAAVEANVTAAVMIDLPLHCDSEVERLNQIASRSNRLRTGTRALASRFVMDAVGELLPPIGHAWFARTVYGWRYFHAIVSNMPGPQTRLTLAGLRIDPAFPILPLAPGAPLAIGALGWNDQLCLGLSVHPGLVPEIEVLQTAVLDAFQELSGHREMLTAGQLSDALG